MQTRTATFLFVYLVSTHGAFGADKPDRQKALTAEGDVNIHSYLKNSDIFACEAKDSRTLDMPTKLAAPNDIPCIVRVECGPKEGKRQDAKAFTFPDEAAYLLACPGDKAKKQCPSVADCASYAGRDAWNAKSKATEKVKDIATDRVEVVKKADDEGQYFTNLGRTFKFVPSGASAWSGFCANFVDSPKAAKASDRVRLAVCQYTKNARDEDVCPAPAACLEAMSDDVKKLIQVASIAPPRNDVGFNTLPHGGVQQAGASFTSSFPASTSSKGATALPASKSHETRFGTTVRSQNTDRGATAGAPRGR